MDLRILTRGPAVGRFVQVPRDNLYRIIGFLIFFLVFFAFLDFFGFVWIFGSNCYNFSSVNAVAPLVGFEWFVYAC